MLRGLPSTRECEHLVARPAEDETANDSVTIDVGRGPVLLTAATLVAGAFAYVFVVVGARSFGAEAFAPATVLWTIWSACVAVLMFPIQQYVVQTVVASSRHDEHRVAEAAPTFALATAAIMVAVAVVSVLFGAQLFGAQVWPFALAAISIPLGTAVLGLSRGLQIARRQVGAAASSLALENVVRVVALVAAGRSGNPTLAALAVPAGFLVVLLWPRSLRVDRTGDRITFQPSEPGRSNRDEPSARSFLATVGIGSLLAQVCLTSGPFFLALIGGAPAEVTAAFATMSVFRAPFLLVVGASPELTRLATELVARGRRDMVRRMQVGVSVATVVLALAAAGIGSVSVPLMSALFDLEDPLSPGLSAAVAAGSVLAVGALGHTIRLVAASATRVVGLTWAVATGTFGGALLIGSLEPLPRVTFAFCAAHVVAFAGLAFPVAGRSIDASARVP